MLSVVDKTFINTMKSLIVLAFFSMIMSVNSVATRTDSDGSLLRLANLVYRHGDRSPNFIYPNDIHQVENTWTDGMGWLTRKGMQEQYELGQFLRSRYMNGYFLSDRYNNEEIHIESSSLERCLMSAASNLAGMYPPEGDQVWNSSILWQPIPIKSRPKPDDNKLALGVPCPKYDELLHDVIHSDVVKEQYGKDKEFYDYLSEVTGMEMETLAELWEVYDPLYCEWAHDLPWNDWVTEMDFEKVEDLRTFGWGLVYGTPEMARLTGGPLLKEIILHLTEAADTKLFLPKVYMYSAHDSTVGSLMEALKIFWPHQPPYAALVMVELWETKDKEFIVKTLYRNDTTVEPYELTPEGCSSPCTLQEFVSVLEDTTPVDWHAECYEGISSGSNLVPSAVWLGLIGSILNILCLF